MKFFVRKEPSGEDKLRVTGPRTLTVGRKVAKALNLEGSIVVGAVVYPPGQPTESSGGFSVPAQDFSFVIEGHEYPAHTAILRNERAGSYFRSLVTLPFEEASDRRVHIPGIKKGIFRGILQYIYTGRAVFKDGRAVELLDLYRAADRFQMTPLTSLIKTELLLLPSNSTPDPTELLTLIQQMKGFPDLVEAVTTCVKVLLPKWGEAKKCRKWKEVAGDNVEVRSFMESLIDAAAELQKQASA
ncbi:hypothetical protein HK104_006276 [Borealophlyctis nickersoniae]|nr:hypothetical protein HK104_006276 [Borealophlyctis nickersoniae]